MFTFTFTYLAGIPFLLHDELLLRRIALLLLSWIVLHELVVISRVLTTIVDHIPHGIFHIPRIIVRTYGCNYIYI